MEITRRLILFLALSVLLTACGADPRDQAEAEAMRAESFAASESAFIARQQQIKLNEIALQEAQRELEIKQAATDKAKQVYGWMIYWGGIAVTIALVSVIISVGRGVNIALVKSGEAIGRKAMVQANLIYLDARTGMFPQMLEYIGNGKYSLTDMNDHSTRMLDTKNEADLLAVRGAIAIRHALVMSAAASRSKDPTGVAMVQPLVIDNVEE